MKPFLNEMPVVSRSTGRRVALGGVLAVLLGAVAILDTDRAASSVVVAGRSDFAGLVDVGGGRRMYLECRGQVGPTVVLISGYGDHGGVWSMPSPDVPQPQVLPGVAALTRVCAYDRPGTIGDPDDPTDRSRSDPVPQPHTAGAAVADLHALLHTAGVPGPYVLVGHSLGGLYARLYAATYPDDVVGLVLVDAFSEALRAAMTPEQWAAFLVISQAVAALPELASYQEFERVDFDAALDEVLSAAAQPLRRMPLVVLSAGVIADVSESGLDLPPGFQETLVAAQRASQAFLAGLQPDARHVVVTESGHYIQVEQPREVIDAIQQVVDALRSARNAR